MVGVNSGDRRSAAMTPAGAPLRRVEARYEDALEVVWSETARRLGMSVQRDDAAYASWDGRGTLTIATPAEMDADDNLAQMILHEICHAAVEGPGAWRQRDWGLDNVDDRHLVQEHACHRLQAALADRVGLREFLAVTTDWRPYWDSLPAAPLASGDDPAIPLAVQAWQRLEAGPWWTALDEALVATAMIARACAPFASVGSLWARCGRDALLDPRRQGEGG